MLDGTTPPANSGVANAPQGNDWESRYVGLQKIVAKRDEALHTTQAQLDALQAAHEAAQAELNDFRQKTVDASEEDAARQQFEALKERFESEPPTPVGNNPAKPARGWEDGDEHSWSGRERTGSAGFPL